MRDIEALILRGVAVVKTVLMRPKNMAKGDFTGSTEELFEKAMVEMHELRDEVILGNDEKALYEAGDACAYLFMMMQKIMERQKINVCMYENKVCLTAEKCEDSVCACYEREGD